MTRNAGVSRRGFLRVAAGGTAATAATGTAAAQETETGTGTQTGTQSGEQRPDFEGYLDDVGNFTGIEDMRGQDEVTIEVGVEANGGAFGFGPAAVHVDTGTTIVWEWTGEGGGHNVVAEDGTFESGSPVEEAGTTFEWTAGEDGVYNYFCEPHRTLEMKGSVVVGEDYPTTTDSLATATPSGETESGGGDEGGGDSGGGGDDGGGAPDLGGYLDDVSNFSGVEDMTGQDEITVDVGVDNGGQPYGFGPAAVHVDIGTTVVWEWTGEGGGHNVVAEDETFNSGSPVPSEGATFEYTFEEGGIYNYFCSPHKSLQMKGSIVVGTPGEDYETVEPEGSGGGTGGPPALPNSAKTIGIATSSVMAVTLGLAYFFMKYGGDYEPPD